MTTPTIAELQLNINSRPIVDAKDALVEFTSAAGRAKQATDGLNSSTSGNSGGIAPEGETRKVRTLSEAIDSQTRKLNELARQRQLLESSGKKSTAPQEYQQLNNIIDANIALVMRQGNAVDRLSASQKRDAEAEEARSNAKLRIQERLLNASVRQENIVTAAAARQQRSIEQTINGLSRQIAAQNEYNATIEKLNKARDIGATVGGSGGISGAEYESYVKLAQARRDAAYATEDNSRALAAAQSRLDTYVASLGKAERAEVQYSRAVATLDDNLAKGTITQDTYNQRLEQFTAKRDQLVSSANSNAAAEERYARQLREVLGAYDPVIRAQQQYNNAVGILSNGLQNGVISVEQFNKALREQVSALDAVKESRSGTSKIASEFDSALDSAVRYRTELRNLDEQQKRLEAGQRAGLVQTAAQKDEYKVATAAIAEQRREIEKRIDAGKRNAITIGQERAALRGLPAQFTDIVVSLQGGQAPLTVFLQQGGQIRDQFGSIGDAIKGVGRGLVSIVNPLSVAATVVATLGIAAYQGADELQSFNKAITQSRNAVGLSAGEFTTLRTELQSTGASAARSAEVLTLIAANSNIAADGVGKVAEAALNLNRATGAELSKTVEDFASLGKEPVEAAVRLDSQYKFLTASVLAQADALVQQGKEQQATLLLQGKLADAVSESSKQIIEDAGYVERAWVAVKDSVIGVFDAIRNIGRDASPSDELNKLLTRQAEIQRLNRGNQAALKRSNEYQENENQIRILRIRVGQEKELADLQADNERKRDQSVSSQAAINRRVQNSLEGVAKAQNDLEIAQRDAERVRAAGNVSAKQEELILKDLANAEKKLAEAKEKANRPGRAGALDTTSVTEVKSNLSLINAEYDGYYKRVTALGEANVVSAQATYYSQVAILQAQRKATEESYNSQLDAINKLQANKKNSNAQNISLANQETKAEAAKAKALEDIDTRLDVLQTKENGRVAERTRNIAAYKAALDSQIDNLREQGARDSDGVGRGSRQAALNQQIGALERQYERQQRELAKALSGGQDPEENRRNLENLTAAHTALKDQILANDEEIKMANADWTNGFMSALEDAEDQATNFAGSVNQAISGAFNASGQALAEFVTTGKLNFKSFASSVIADMARIAAQQAASGILSSILRFGATAAGAYFGGGAGAAATTGASGAGSFGAIGGSYTGTGVFAKGGAFSGGTQYFANGGAFTNSVVSSTTEFPMSGGRKGVMGEAGPEAIVPLARTRNGDLGIRAEGFGGGGNGGNTTVIDVKVYVDKDNSSASTDGGSAYDQFGASLGAFVRQEIYTVINTETRSGGSLQAQNN